MDQLSTGGLKIVFDPRDSEDCSAVLRIVREFQPGVVYSFFDELNLQQEASRGRAYLKVLLQELGILQFLTNPAAEVLGRRLMTYIEDPAEAAQMLTRALILEEDPKRAISILMGLVDGLRETDSLASFATGLLRALGNAPVTKSLYELIDLLNSGKEIRQKRPLVDLLLDLVEFYVPRPYSVRKLAEILWELAQGSETPLDFTGRFRSKFRRLSVEQGSPAPEDLAVMLLKNREQRVFFQLVAGVVGQLGLPQGTLRNSTFAVLVNTVQARLAPELDLTGKITAIAEQLRTEFVKHGQSADSLREYLVSAYGLDTEELKYAKALNWLVSQVEAWVKNSFPTSSTS